MMNAFYAKISIYAFISIQKVIRRDGDHWKRRALPWSICRACYKAIWGNWLTTCWQKTLYGL